MENRWTGRISVNMTVQTPLLIHNLPENPDAPHKRYRIRRNPDGTPDIPWTSIKGMLSSAYEAATNSRFRIFHARDSKLFFRRDSNSAVNLVPCRIESNSEDSLEIQLLPGTSVINPDGGPSGHVPFVYAAWMMRYREGQAPGSRNLRHQQEVWAYVIPWEYKKPLEHGEIHFHFWNACDIRPAGPEPQGAATETRLGRPTRWRIDGQNAPKVDWVKGYAYISNQNMPNKHDERVFFVMPDHPQQDQLLITQTGAEKSRTERQWGALISDYKTTNDKAIKQRRTDGRDPRLFFRNQDGPPDQRRPPDLAYSEHILERESGSLSPGTLCYAAVKKEDGRFKLQALYPVAISRDQFPASPGDLLHGSLRPAMALTDLSPADRVFGWVCPQGKGAYAGQISGGPVSVIEGSEPPIEAIPAGDLPLAILGGPKPQQTRFYLRKKGSLAACNRMPKRDGYNKEDHVLSGRKCYPHHRSYDAVKDYWNPIWSPEGRRTLAAGNVVREYIRAGGRETDQNRTILEWIKPGASFHFDLDIRNLSDVELGALLWILQLPPEHYHRLGYGKPLGFGSVRLDIDWGKTKMRTGDGWRERYLGAEPNEKRQMPADPIKCVETFKSTLESAYRRDGQDIFDKISFIQDFKLACFGWNDSLPIHYPRSAREPDPDGKNFTWFVANEKPRARLALSWAPGDPGLPYDI